MNASSTSQSKVNVRSSAPSRQQSSRAASVQRTRERRKTPTIRNLTNRAESGKTKKIAGLRESVIHDHPDVISCSNIDDSSQITTQYEDTRRGKTMFGNRKNQETPITPYRYQLKRAKSTTFQSSSVSGNILLDPPKEAARGRRAITPTPSAIRSSILVQSSSLAPTSNNCIQDDVDVLHGHRKVRPQSAPKSRGAELLEYKPEKYKDLVNEQFVGSGFRRASSTNRLRSSMSDILASDRFTGTLSDNRSALLPSTSYTSTSGGGVLGLPLRPRSIPSLNSSGVASVLSWT